MTVQVQRAENPLALFCRNLFRAGPLMANMGNANESPVTLAELETKPRQTQLLMAHFLERNTSDLMLLDRDPDVSTLLPTGWLTSVPCATIGVVCFKIKPHIWRQLRSLRPMLLGNSLSELKSYRKAKSALYPWIW